MEVIIVTGGANGLGKELTKEAIKLDKYFICNIDWDKKALEKIDLEFLKISKNYRSFYGDISDENFVKATISEISNIGNIKFLFNNAGKPCFKLPTENTTEVLDTTFKGLFGMIYMSSHVLKHMENHGGKVINIMSSAALRGNKQESAYCATKWGERGYTESLKVAYKGTNIKIVGVYPGGINTDFYKNSRDYVSIEKQQTFMPASDLAKLIINNIFNDYNLQITDIIIERNS